LTILQLFFSFRGRIGRGPYWLGVVATTVFIYLVLELLRLAQALLGGADPNAAAPNAAHAVTLLVVALVGLMAICVCIWAHCAVQAKRWHDRDKSAWWVAIGLIPIIGGLWALIECGFLPGGQGRNRYDTAPAPSDIAATFA
jgi:uncharacterized membrane protein YhaH (DUF805 family)